MHDGKFFLISPHDAVNANDTMRVYDFAREYWMFLELPERPPATINVLLGVYGEQLIQFGGDITLGTIRLT